MSFPAFRILRRPRLRGHARMLDPIRMQRHIRTLASVRSGAPSELEYLELRKAQVGALQASPYPSAAACQNIMSSDAFIKEYDPACSAGVWIEDKLVAIVGRVVLRRDSSKNLVFLVLERDGHQIQVVMNRKHWPDDQDAQFSTLLGAIGLGDILCVQGVPGRTKSGQLSLRLSFVQMLAPCLHRFPKKNTIITDENLLLRQRYIDMLVNQKTIETFKTKSRIIRQLRSFLDTRGFIEMETPVLSTMSGGANAKPFKTRIDALHMDLELRIAPELYLKQLVIGGIERVYEIGKQFRNEGIDSTHNPEFTTCELYQAYGTLSEIMDLTESLMKELAQSVTGSTSVPWTSNTDAECTIDFGAPFKRIHIVPELEKELGLTLPDLNDHSSIPTLLDICAKAKIQVNKPVTLPRIIDKLVSELIEPKCIQPTFVIGHPISMSPLAKEGHQPGISDRFELFIGAREFANAYQELTDPAEQRRRFVLQTQDKDQGDAEAQALDESFCVALEYGLPPCVGWGLGIDRLAMLLTQSSRIKDVIPFPIVKPE